MPTPEVSTDQYQNHYDAYFRIFNRCGVPAVAVQSDVGMMGGTMAHEYMYLTPVGEDTLLFCDGCGYAANRQVATVRKSAPEAETALPLEKVATPNTKTIADLAVFLDIPQARTAKAVFMVATAIQPAKPGGPGVCFCHRARRYRRQRDQAG
jgi:prolyl-tRNA synthetase